MSYSETYLAHHGVKGMKWGVRRFQRKDGTRTSAGKKQARLFEKKNASKSASKSKKQSGKQLTDEEVAKHKKTIRNVLIGTAAVSAAAAIGYGVYRHNKYGKDLVVSGENALQRVALKSEKTLPDNVYVAISKGDKSIYKHNFPRTLKGITGETNFDLKTLRPNKELKIASPKSTEKLYNEYKRTNKDFAKTFKNFSYKDMSHYYVNLNKTNQGQNIVDMAKGGKIVELPNGSKDALKQFTGYMQQKGYSGMMDLNDMDFARNPAIIFNGNNLSVDKIANVGVDYSPHVAESGKMMATRVLDDPKLSGMLISTPALAGSSFAIGRSQYIKRRTNGNKKKK